MTHKKFSGGVRRKQKGARGLEKGEKREGLKRRRDMHKKEGRNQFTSKKTTYGYSLIHWGEELIGRPKGRNRVQRRNTPKGGWLAKKKSEKRSGKRVIIKGEGHYCGTATKERTSKLSKI